MKVKLEHNEFELSVLELRYDSVSAPAPNALQKNTIEFERLPGLDHDHPLLTVNQEVSFGEGDARATVKANWGVVHDETEIEHLTGDLDEEIGEELHEKEDHKHGLILLGIVTDKGGLKIEE